MWMPIKKSSGKRIDTLLSDDEKRVWETHPTTRRIYTFTFEKEPEKPKIDPPNEARDFKKVAAPEPAANPKKPNESPTVNETTLLPNSLADFTLGKKGRNEHKT